MWKGRVKLRQVGATIVALLVVSGPGSVPRPDFLPRSGVQAVEISDLDETPPVQIGERARRPFDNVYAATLSGELRPEFDGVPARVYVPNSEAGTVDVIDPATFRVIDHFVVGGIPHHVAPSWDLKTLYVDIEATNSLTVIAPSTGQPAGKVLVEDPYNLYFTPDGSMAIVVAEVFQRLDFRDPHTWQLIKSVNIPWPGVDHL